MRSFHERTRHLTSPEMFDAVTAETPRVNFEFVGFRPSSDLLKEMKSSVQRFLRGHHWGYRIKASVVALLGTSYQVTVEAREGLRYGRVKCYGTEIRDMLKSSLAHLKLAPDDEWNPEIALPTS